MSLWTGQPSYSNDNAVSEDRLIERAKTDPAEFAPLYEAYFPRIYAYVWRRLGQAQEAEDLTGLIFARAIAALSKYRGGSVAAWLFQIAHNAIANYWRDRKLQVSLEQAADMPDGSAEALDKVLQQEARQKVAQLIAALPEDSRELLALSVAGKLTAKEIGQVVGKNEGAVRMALHRIVTQLRKQYQEADGEEL